MTDASGTPASASFVLPAGHYRIESWPDGRVLDELDVPAAGGPEIVRLISVGS